MSSPSSAAIHSSGFGEGGVPLTDKWNPPFMPVRGQNKNFGVIVGPSERSDRDSMRPDHRELLQRSFELSQQLQLLEARDQRQHTVSYNPYEQMPIYYAVPCPDSSQHSYSPNPTSGGPVPGTPMPQQHPLNLGTYREDLRFL